MGRGWEEGSAGGPGRAKAWQWKKKQFLLCGVISFRSLWDPGVGGAVQCGWAVPLQRRTGNLRDWWNSVGKGRWGAGLGQRERVCQEP